jgi:WD40 repeat protein
MDGRRAVSGSYEKTLRVWDLDSGECLLLLQGHTESVYSVAVCTDGRRAVSGSLDKTLRVWDLKNGACLGAWFGVNSFNNSALSQPNASGRDYVVTGCRDGSVHFFELLPPGRVTHTTLAAWSPTHLLSGDISKPEGALRSFCPADGGKDESTRIVFFDSITRKGNHYEIYEADNKSVALLFLRGEEVRDERHFVIVRTPEGNFGRNSVSIFNEFTQEVLESVT